MINKQISDRLYVVKALLILCTVYAHISPAKTEYSWIMKQIGTFGVPTFLVLSGYFFNYQKKFTEFWKNKIKKLIIPWMTWGIVTYLLSIIAQRGGGKPIRWSKMDRRRWFLVLLYVGYGNIGAAILQDK